MHVCTHFSPGIMIHDPVYRRFSVLIESSQCMGVFCGFKYICAVTLHAVMEVTGTGLRGTFVELNYSIYLPAMSSRDRACPSQLRECLYKGKGTLLMHRGTQPCMYLFSKATCGNSIRLVGEEVLTHQVNLPSCHTDVTHLHNFLFSASCYELLPVK